MDTQGYEEQVLAGVARNLSKITAIQLELSLVELYDGEVLYDALIKHLNEAGFKLWNLLPGFRNSKSGQLLQVDGFFLNCREQYSPFWNNSDAL